MTRLDDAVRQVGRARGAGARPWPLPEEPWLLGQTWERLLFVHWRVASPTLRPHVPASLELEEWDGSAWLGLTPWRVAGFRLHGLPPLPLLSRFHGS